MQTPHALQQMAGCIKDVAQVIEDNEAEIIPDVGPVHWGQPKFETVQKQRRASRGLTRAKVAWTRLVDRESPVRVSPASKEALRKGNRDEARQDIEVGLRQDGIVEGLLEADPGGTGKHHAFPANRVIGGVLNQQAGKVSLRSEVPRRPAHIERGVVSLGGRDGAVALVTNVDQTGSSDACRLRQERNIVLVEAFGNIHRLDLPVTETIEVGAHPVQLLLQLC